MYKLAGFYWQLITSDINSLLIRYSTEVYFTHGAVQDQLEWLTNDLKEANKPENRAKRPWVIAFGHRPMYCSNIDNDDCATLRSVVRNRSVILIATFRNFLSPMDAEKNCETLPASFPCHFC